MQWACGRLENTSRLIISVFLVDTPNERNYNPEEIRPFCSRCENKGIWPKLVFALKALLTHAIASDHVIDVAERKKEETTHHQFKISFDLRSGINHEGFDVLFGSNLYVKCLLPREPSIRRRESLLSLRCLSGERFSHEKFSRRNVARNVMRQPDDASIYFFDQKIRFYR